MDEERAEIGAELPTVGLPACSSTMDGLASVTDHVPGIVDGEPRLLAATEFVSGDIYGRYMESGRAEVGAEMPQVSLPACSTGEVLASVSSLLDGLDHEARGGVGHRERLAFVEQALVVADRVSALVGVLVAEAEAADSAMIVRGTPLSSWIGLTAHTSARAAAGLVFTGRDLVGRPGVRDAVLAGRIGVPQARTIVKVMSQLPEGLNQCQEQAAEGLLLGHAEVSTPEELAALVPAVVEQVCPELAEDREGEQVRLAARAKRARGRRGLSFVGDGDGSVLFRGSLPELDAAPFITLIDAYVESDRRAARDQLDPLAEMRTAEQRRADGLIALLAALQRSQQAPRLAGDRPRLVVTMRETELRDRAEQAGVLAAGAQITAGDLRRLCCDADLMPVVLGAESEVLDVGQTRRLVTSAIRKALSLRDGGCVFPGCDAPDARCDAHHLLPWWAGGRTALWNLVLLCPHHHQLVEPPRFWTGPPPDRWQIRLDQHGLPEVIPPRRVDPNQKPMKRARKGEPGHHRGAPRAGP